jgi:hypothetical protein
MIATLILVFDKAHQKFVHSNFLVDPLLTFRGFDGSPMPDILIRCPVFKRPVRTGLTTEAIVFDSLDDLSIPLRCPACQKVHKWQRKDAWIANETNGSRRADVWGSTSESE